MGSVGVNDILDDPLAGCLDIFRDEVSASQMEKSLFLRLRIFYREPDAVKLSDKIFEEAENMPFSKWEYIINEMQYEIRRAYKDYSSNFETVLLNSWMYKLMQRIQQDDALDFMVMIKKYREERPR